MKARQIARLRELPAESWDALFPPDYPFTRHRYLSGLEEHGCLGQDAGWQPCHLLLEDDAGRLRAAAPLYLKAHSYGEFVFDFSWARASQQLGREYYPKLVCAIPFVPASGPRLGADSESARLQLLERLAALAPQAGLSSTHVLFADAPAPSGWLERQDLQYHWFNRDYADFADFTARLRSDKRKKLLRDRRSVQQAGLRFEWRRGEDLSEAEWAQVFALYANTYAQRGQAPYLTADFLLACGQAPGSPMRVVLCRDGSRMVAMALCLEGGDTLYGRHWGAAEHYDALHFETCYHQGIEFCLREGLRHFDAGTQGEHKRSRGFEPVLTRSWHQLTQPRLHQAVAEFLVRERAAVAQSLDEMRHHGAYRTDIANADG